MDYDMTALARALRDRAHHERSALGAGLRVWRIRAGMTQDALATAAGVRRDRVSQVEGGRVAISGDYVARVADIVGAVNAPPAEVSSAMARAGGGL